MRYCGGPRPRTGVRAAARRTSRSSRRVGDARDHGAQRQRSRRQRPQRCSRSARCATSAACRRSPICSPTTARGDPAEAALDALARIANAGQRAAASRRSLPARRRLMRGIADRRARARGRFVAAARDSGGDRQGARIQRDAGRRLCVGAARQRVDRSGVGLARPAPRCANRRSAT